MTIAPKTNSLSTYQVMLFEAALHPELFDLRDRRVVRHGDYEFEAWLMPGGHAARFEARGKCATELVTDRESDLPSSGQIVAFLAAGERDYEHGFESWLTTYITTVQTETLSENLYLSTHRELVEFGREAGAMSLSWKDSHGPCLSLLDVQRHQREVHFQGYHLIANGGIVLRTQSIFEPRES